MDVRLHEAAIRGDVTSLLDLLQRDEHILNKVTAMDGPIANENPLHVAAQFGLVDFAKEILSRPTANENPLHVAAQFGHVDFAKEILSREPKYGHKLNSQGQSPLHLASGEGHVEVVKLLLEKDAGVCFIRDKRGRTPLHIAARKGRLEVLKELVGAKPTAAWVRTEQGEPILHLCASNGQFEALKMLIELIPNDDFVNMKDDDDNSILHLLAPEIEIEVIKFLLRNRNLEINCLNMKKYTPLDALVKAPRRSGYGKCKRILCVAGGKRAKELSQALATTHSKNTWEAHANWLNETKSTMMVVAILIATVTFQATLNPPGGVWQDDYPPLRSPGEDETKIKQWYLDNKDYIDGNMHVAGQAVMSFESPFEYVLFLSFNLTSLLSSTSIILLLTSGFNLKRRELMWALMIAMWISISSLVVAYVVCLIYLTDHYTLVHARIDNAYASHSQIYIISICAVLVLIGPLVTAHVVRFVIRLWKKFKRRAGSENRDGAAIQMSVDPSTPVAIQVDPSTRSP